MAEQHSMEQPHLSTNSPTRSVRMQQGRTSKTSTRKQQRQHQNAITTNTIRLIDGLVLQLFTFIKNWL